MTTSTFELIFDGQTVQACAGETLWQLARRLGETIPHLCLSEQTGYRADGNCRACMVEVEGERALVASCMRDVQPGMVVRSRHSSRALQARQTVLELLAADQPAPEAHPDRGSHLQQTLAQAGISRAAVQQWLPPQSSHAEVDASHPAFQFNPSACITCGLCVRACREVQVNDVIGIAGRGDRARVVFDLDAPIRDSSCVACGECVQVCPTGALMPHTLLDAEGCGDSSTIEQRVRSVCPYCGVGCQLEYQLRGGRIVNVVGVEGPSNLGRLCVKGRFGLDYVTHPARLLKPLIRREGVAKKLDPAFDPAHPLTHFREASWEEALDLAARGLVRQRIEHGPAALAGFGSAKCSNEEAYLFQKLVRTGFGNHQVDHCTRLCHASSVAALLESLGSGAVTASFMQAAESDLIILIGCNPASNHPVAASWFKQAAKRGTRLVIMDPRGQPLSRHAWRHLRFTPGSDVALLSALLQVIIAEQLYDRDYIDAHTDGFEALCAQVAEMTPERMAPLCGIEPDVLREVARAYAGAERAMIFWGMGVTQHVHGTDNARCLIALALACGQTGRPGTGLHPLRGQNNVQGASDAGLIPMFLPNYQAVADASMRAAFERLWGTPLSRTPGLTVVEIIDAIDAGTITGMYILGENPAMSDPNLNHTRAALAKLAHLVVQDLFVTETAQLADVILPAAAWAEKDGSVTNTNRQVQMGRAAVPLPGEVKPDWWIIQEIAQRFGLPWCYQGPEQVYAEMQLAMPSLAHISWARLQAEHSVTYPCHGADEAGEDIVFQTRFPTASGRARFVPVAPTPADEPPDDDYPLVLITGRQLEHWHTGAMTRRSAVLEQLEPDAWAALAPEQLQQLALSAGMSVELQTRRGSVRVRLRADPLMQPGTVFMPFCYAEAAANLLTNAALDPWGKIPELKYAACRVRPAPSAGEEGVY